jgi:hypothetical protein
VAAPQRGLVLVEEGAAHARQPTASGARAATARGTAPGRPPYCGARWEAS